MANEYRYFSKSTFLWVKRLFVLIYFNINNNSKRFKAPKSYLPKAYIT